MQTNSALKTQNMKKNKQDKKVQSKQEAYEMNAAAQVQRKKEMAMINEENKQTREREAFIKNRIDAWYEKRREIIEKCEHPVLKYLRKLRENSSIINKSALDSILFEFSEIAGYKTTSVEFGICSLYEEVKKEITICVTAFKLVCPNVKITLKKEETGEKKLILSWKEWEMDKIVLEDLVFVHKRPMYEGMKEVVMW